MKPNIILGTVFSAALLLTACDPKHNTRPPNKPAPGKKTDAEPPKPGTRTLEPGNETTDSGSGPAPDHNIVDTNPHSNVPPPPKPESAKDEYAKKITGKPGFVTDPNDPQGRPLDVRNMPPGTKIQSPFSGSVLLVPPQ